MPHASISRKQQKADAQRAFGWVLLLNLADAHNIALPDDIDIQFRIGAQLCRFLLACQDLLPALKKDPDRKLQFQNLLQRFLKLHCG